MSNPAPEPPVANPAALTQAELARYSRHMLLPEIGEEGQRRLRDARVLIVGLGGLGSPVAMYLAASGVGELVLSDFDFVELSNLQRQIVHTNADVDRNKVDSAADTISRLNPLVRVTPLAYALDEADLAEQVRAADVVVDASDNFETRFALNAACVEARVPLVSGAAVRMEGQISVFDSRVEDSPCYRCLYSDESNEDGEPCSRVGVLAPLLGIIGSVQAAETLKLLAGFGETLAGRVVFVDAYSMEWRAMKLARNPKCAVCGSTG